MRLNVNDQQIVPQDLEVEDLPINFAYLLGRRVTCITSRSLIAAIDNACVARKKIVVANYNIHSFNMSVQFSWFYDFLQKADIAHCDGLGIIYALRFMGYQIPKDYRVSYSILMPKLLSHSNKNNFSVYLLGAKNQNVQMALDNIRQQYPNIRVAGHHGYFSINDTEINQKIISEINEFSPNILIVGMGMPIQEYWVQKYQNILNVNSILLGGAAIDRLAGAVPNCPEVISKFGFEWLYRLIREPRRLATRYIVGNTAFLLQVALAKSQKFSQ
jgi:N-acetylglucosaminyldiphosphoundecaprenol N-acetyl-beta-D-mannosaminyltransferase